MNVVISTFGFDWDDTKIRHRWTNGQDCFWYSSARTALPGSRTDRILPIDGIATTTET